VKFTCSGIERGNVIFSANRRKMENRKFAMMPGDERGEIGVE
jgi:hypothetical protein